MANELTASWPAVGLAAGSVAVIFIAVIVATRIAGLRSFSKMSAFDFASTVAIGSTMAGVGMAGSSLAVGATVLATLFAMQVVVAGLRRRSHLDRLVDNQPLLLMAGQRILWDHLALARITEQDLKSVLRAANVVNYEHVHAVVLETTGDMSVLHGSDRLDADLIDGVRGREEIA